MNNLHLWRQVFWRWFPRLCGHVFDVVGLLFVATCLAWFVYIGFNAP